MRDVAIDVFKAMVAECLPFVVVKYQAASVARAAISMDRLYICRYLVSP